MYSKSGIAQFEWSKLEWPPSFQFIGIDKIRIFIRSPAVDI